MLHICCFAKTFHFCPSAAFPKIDASTFLSLSLSLWAIGDFFCGKLAPACFLAFCFALIGFGVCFLRSLPAEASVQLLLPSCC